MMRGKPPRGFMSSSAQRGHFIDEAGGHGGVGRAEKVLASSMIGEMPVPDSFTAGSSGPATGQLCSFPVLPQQPYICMGLDGLRRKRPMTGYRQAVGKQRGQGLMMEGLQFLLCFASGRDSMVDASTLPSTSPQVHLNVLLVDTRTSSYIWRWHLALGVGHWAFS